MRHGASHPGTCHSLHCQQGGTDGAGAQRTGRTWAPGTHCHLRRFSYSSTIRGFKPTTLNAFPQWQRRDFKRIRKSGP